MTALGEFAMWIAIGGLAEMDELRGRVQELEERVDFSERLLAQQSQSPDR